MLELARPYSDVTFLCEARNEVVFGDELFRQLHKKSCCDNT